MKRLALALGMLMPLTIAAREATIASPGGNIVVTINDEGGRLA